MKYTIRLFASILFSAAVFFVSANAQITSVSQLKDVKPTDKYYAAVQSLVEKYGVLDPFPDYTFRGGQPLTREQFVVLINNGLDRLGEVDAASTEGERDDIGFLAYIHGYDAHQTNITSMSQIKDSSPTDEHFIAEQSLVERYGIILADADKNFRPTKSVTEKEFYDWLSGIFGATISGSPSPTKAISRGEAVIVINAALDSLNAEIAADADKRAEARKIKLVQALPSLGRAQISNGTKFYTRGNKCADLSAADRKLQIAVQDDGVWGDYRIKKGDVGDIIYETRNTCRKNGKIVLMRVGTAIVTMMGDGIKRIK